jgi:hypothetical protein
MTCTKSTFCIAVWLCLLASPSFAESAQDKQDWAKQMGYSNQLMDGIAESCKAKIKFEYEKESWNKVKSQWDSASPNGQCEEVLVRVERFCSSGEAAQKAVAAKVKSILCSYGGKGSGYAISLKSGALSYSAEVDRANVAESIDKFLKSSL